VPFHGGFGNYRISDVDESGIPAYYGYVDKKGNWCIIEDNSTNGTYRYASGDEEYKRQWNLRTKLSYVYFHEL